MARLHKRAELKDSLALHNLALKHGFGGLGLPVDQKKCVDLLREAADLGCLAAQYQLGNFHKNGNMGLEQNEKEIRICFEKAAKGGHVYAWHNLGCSEHRHENDVAATRDFRLSASGGLRMSMVNLIKRFEIGWLHHGDLAKTLQAYYRSRAEMKSKDRDQYIEHLKRTGEYKEEYGLYS